MSNADNGVTVLVMRYLDKFERWYIIKFDYKNVQHTFVQGTKYFGTNVLGYGYKLVHYLIQ